MLTILTTIGFPLITLIFFVLFLKELKSAITATSWKAEKKKKVNQKIITGLVIYILHFLSLKKLLMKS